MQSGKPSRNDLARAVPQTAPMNEDLIPLSPLVVIDTMIVLGAIIGKPNGSDARVLRLVETASLRLASSDAWLRELSDVLSRPEITALVSDPGRAFRVALTVGTTGAAYRPERFDWPSLSDPKDWWMLDLAFESGADAIITRDKKVLKAAPKLGFEALTSPQLLEQWESSEFGRFIK